MNKLRTVESCYVVFGLLYMARGVFPTESSQGDVSHWQQFNALSFAAQALLFAILGFLVFAHRARIIEELRARTSGWIWPLSLVALAILSSAWSDEHIFTFRRALILAATSVFALYVGSCFDRDEQLDLFGWMSVIAVTGSFFMAAFFPQYGLSHDLHSGDWKGLFPHKNALGMQMAFAMIVLWIGRPKGVAKWLMVSAGTGAAILLILAHSATSLALTILIFMFYAAFHIFRLRRSRTLPLWIALTPLVVSLAIGAVAEKDKFLALLSRDSTFTGRTELWSAVADAIQVRPVLGYGYAVFWRWGATGDASDVITAIHWTGVEQAHNGYLDLCLDLGLAGLILFACGFFAAFRRAAREFTTESGRLAKWPLMFLLFFFLYNFVEGSLLQLYTFLWVPYVAVFVSLTSVRMYEQSSAIESRYQMDEPGVRRYSPEMSPQ